MMLASRWAFSLAIVATATALSLSILAGWQRGGTLPERLVWVALGIVLVVSAHMLPALVRGSSQVVRFLAAVLWVACMACAYYGHATFFLLAQQHAGEERAQAVAEVMPAAVARSMTAVMAERATVTRQLALARLQRCPRDCSALEARRVTLMARLGALDAEAGDIHRRQAGEDRIMTQRDAQRADPVTVRLAALLDTTVTRLDLLAGLMFAAVLEGVACLLWTVALQSCNAVAVAPIMPPVTVSVAESITTQVLVSHKAVPAAAVAVRDSAARPKLGDAPEAELARVAEEVAAGRVRATVADIRRHLGCSQAKAAALRRQLARRQSAHRNVTA